MDHHEAILDQFTRQAGPFAAAPHIQDEGALRLVVEFTGARVTGYRLEGELEGLLARSFPNPGDAHEIRRRFAASLADDTLGIGTRRVGGQIHFGYPIAILVADR